MRKLFLYCVISVSLIAYFSLTLFILPPNFLEKPKLVPQPTFDVTLEKLKINLGESFEIKVTSNNIGDSADIQIVSIQFPNLTEINETVKITEYNFTQSPHYVLVGDTVGSEYTAGQKLVAAKYPSIEAYSRPINTGDQYHIGLQVMPDSVGTFIIHVKSVILPHYTDSAHYPQSGNLDYQGEYVEAYSV